jgi:hypothetical protein
LEILACINHCKTNPFETLTPALAEKLGQVSTTICIFLDWDKHRREMAQHVVQSGCHLKLILICEGDTTEPLDESEFEDIVWITPASVLEGAIETL